MVSDCCFVTDLSRMVAVCWHALHPAAEAGHSPHLGSDQTTGLRKQQMEEVSRATQGLFQPLETVMCAAT